MSHPVSEVELTLNLAGVAKDIIDPERLKEARAICDAPMRTFTDQQAWAMINERDGLGWTAQASREYEEGILQLATLVPDSLVDVDREFKIWAGSSGLTVRVAMAHCVNRAQRGLSLPWKRDETVIAAREKQ